MFIPVWHIIIIAVVEGVVVDVVVVVEIVPQQ